MSAEPAEGGGLSGFPHEDLPPLLEAIGLLDKSQDALIAACDNLAENPSEQNQMDVGLCGSMVLKTFRNSIDAITASIPSEAEQIDLITQLMIDGDRKRVEFFKEKSGCEGFGVLEGEDDEGNTIDFAETLKQLAIGASDMKTFYEMVCKGLEANLNDDINHFAHHTLEQAEVQEAYRQQIGRHALDVAKISTGVVIGAWIARRLRLF